MTANTTQPKNSGKFGKGNPGKPKGAVQKNTAAIKDMIKAALEQAGGVDYLVKRAHDPKTASAFLGLVGKVMPMQLTGADGGPVEVGVTFQVVGVLPQT